MKQPKTNVMRILERKKIQYTAHYYDANDGRLDGKSVADKLNQNKDQVFKTLVTVSKGLLYVFVIPVDRELDLKKAAAAAGVKNVEMLPQKDLFPKTGYVHGGCSPIGMKKQSPIAVDSSAVGFDTVIFSGGKVGTQVEISPADLQKVTGAVFADLCKQQ